MAECLFGSKGDLIWRHQDIAFMGDEPGVVVDLDVLVDEDDDEPVGESKPECDRFLPG